MGIRVNPNQEVRVEVSYVNPTFAVSYVDAEAAYSYIQPIFKANYIDVQVFAAVTMPDVLAVDVVTPTDLVALTTQKSFSDTYPGFLDSILKTLSKTSADSITSVDSTQVALSKILADTQTLADQASFNVIKEFFDSVPTADLASLAIVKQIADIANISTDSVAYSIQKALADSTTFTDFVITTLIYIRNFTDTASATDQTVLDTALDKLDVLSFVDDSSVVSNKGVSETLILLDNMDGDIEYAFVKLISELLVTSDAQAVDFALNKSDNMLLSSSGTLLMQDYCDITYFLEDYVGTSRTFT